MDNLNDFFSTMLNKALNSTPFTHALLKLNTPNKCTIVDNNCIYNGHQYDIPNR